MPLVFAMIAKIETGFTTRQKTNISDILLNNFPKCPSIHLSENIPGVRAARPEGAEPPLFLFFAGQSPLFPLFERSSPLPPRPHPRLPRVERLSIRRA